MSCAHPKPEHWRDLREFDRAQALSLPGVLAAEGEGGDEAYEVGFLNGRYLVEPARERISELEPVPGRALSEMFQILLIRYIGAPNGGDLSGVELSEKELPGGATFFQRSHELPVKPLLDKFGRDVPAFVARGLELGGERVTVGDAGVWLLPFPKIPMTIVLWAADDEFGAAASVIFDRSITDWFTLDMVYITVKACVGRLVHG